VLILPMTPIRKATLLVRHDPALLNNRIFSGEALYGMKSDTYLYIALREQMRARGIELATQDVHPPSEADIVISLDQVDIMQDFVRRSGQQCFLILTEPPVYYPSNYLPARHKVFDKVFTYDYTRVDNKKYFLYYFAIDFESYPPFVSATAEEFSRRKLCTLAAAAFAVSAPPAGSPSLLHERYLTLKWFSDNHPDEFDFYSRGLDPKEFESFRGAGLVKRFLPQTVLQAIAKRRRRVFDKVLRGSIPPEEKVQKLRDYRFYVAYENTGNMPGCISEKIFDCFAASVVPIYLGDPQVNRLIPSACFIDRRKFATHEDLYQFLHRMDYATYAGYLKAIEAFLSSNACANLRPEFNAQLLAKQITE
jgi:hypothetical protein